MRGTADVAWPWLPRPDRSIQAPPVARFGLPVVYLVWVLTVALITPVVIWYGRVRARREGVLRYL